jgi:uncharacterized protein YjbJ (UPF0337 family)
MFNEEILKGKWTELKGEIKTQWGRLTDNEIEETRGNIQSISGIVQQRYGARKEEVQEKLNEILGKFSDETEKVKQQLRDL